MRLQYCRVAQALRCHDEDLLTAARDAGGEPAASAEPSKCHLNALPCHAPYVYVCCILRILANAWTMAVRMAIHVCGIANTGFTKQPIERSRSPARPAACPRWLAAGPPAPRAPSRSAAPGRPRRRPRASAASAPRRCAAATADPLPAPASLRRSNVTKELLTHSINQVQRPVRGWRVRWVVTLQRARMSFVASWHAACRVPDRLSSMLDLLHPQFCPSARNGLTGGSCIRQTLKAPGVAALAGRSLKTHSRCRRRTP